MPRHREGFSARGASGGGRATARGERERAGEETGGGERRERGEKKGSTFPGPLKAGDEEREGEETARRAALRKKGRAKVRTARHEVCRLL